MMPFVYVSNLSNYLLIYSIVYSFKFISLSVCTFIYMYVFPLHFGILHLCVHASHNRLFEITC